MRRFWQWLNANKSSWAASSVTLAGTPTRYTQFFEWMEEVNRRGYTTQVGQHFNVYAMKGEVEQGMWNTVERHGSFR